ncbi:MAG: hypothetical protein P4L99_22400 [Chthoniobacter sp.]|nr:hypothetical protein [Chthoniobacter sp.]
MPEVQALVEAEFDGCPVSVHNLSQWKKGGYQDWLRYQEAVALAEHLYERGEEMQTAQKDRRPMTEVFSLWMTSRMAVSTREIENLKGEARWRRQRQFCADLMKMRRAEHDAEKLQIERERIELQRQKLQFQQELAERKRGDAKKESQPEANAEPVDRDTRDEEKIAWARRPENLERISPILTEEQKEARWREVLHIPCPARAAA